jgi:TPR repeat protein
MVPLTRDRSGGEEEVVRNSRFEADQNHANALFHFALCLKRGESIARNLVESVRWYKLAADETLAAAQFIHLICFDTCEHVGRGCETATGYYKFAAIKVIGTRNSIAPFASGRAIPWKLLGIPKLSPIRVSRMRNPIA